MEGRQEIDDRDELSDVHVEAIERVKCSRKRIGERFLGENGWRKVPLRKIFFQSDRTDCVVS